MNSPRISEAITQSASDLSTAVNRAQSSLKSCFGRDRAHQEHSIIGLILTGGHRCIGGSSLLMTDRLKGALPSERAHFWHVNAMPKSFCCLASPATDHGAWYDANTLWLTHPNDDGSTRIVSIQAGGTGIRTQTPPGVAATANVVLVVRLS